MDDDTHSESGYSPIGGPPRVDPTVLADLQSRLLEVTPAPILDRYRVLGRLGQGGMGTVFVAHDKTLEREVAVKILRDDIGGKNDRERFFTEARALARLSHPNIVAVFDVGEADGRVYIVMECLRGQTLHDWAESEQPTWRERLDVALQAAQGLATAHRAGLIHRDFKPANVMLTADGVAKVLDFGLVLAIDESVSERSAGSDADSSIESGEASPALLPSEARLTLPGVVMGTPAYMAPEQRTGQAIGVATDQYAFCVTLWELLWGERPELGRIPGVPRRGPGAPPAAVAAIVRRGLAADAAARFESMDALIEGLRQAARPRRRVRAGLVLGAVGLGAAAIAAAVPARSNCEPPAGHDSVWAPARRGAFVDALRDSPGKVAPFLQHVDDFVARWDRAWAEACQSEAKAAMACLEPQLQVLESVVAFYIGEDTGATMHGSFDLPGLPNPAACLHPEPGTSGPLRAEVNDAIDFAEERLQAGDFDTGLERLEEALASSMREGSAEGEALIRLEMAALLDASGQAAEASEELVAAFHAAVTAGRDDTALQSAVGAVIVFSDRLGKNDEAAEWVWHANAAAKRLGDDPLHYARVDAANAKMLSARGDLSGAIASYERALDRCRSRLPEGSPEIQLHEENLLGVLIAAGKLDRADRLLVSLKKAFATRYPAGHPAHVRLLARRSHLQVVAGQATTAARTMEAAVASEDPDTVPPEARVQHLASLARLARATGDVGKALALARRAREVAVNNAADTTAVLAQLELLVGLYEAELGFGEAARAKVHTSAAQILDRVGVDRPSWVEARLAEARAHMLAGDPGAALAVAGSITAGETDPLARRAASLVIGRAALRLDEHDTALRAFASAAQGGSGRTGVTHPRDIEAAVGLAEVRRRQGKGQLAAEAISEARAAAAHAEVPARLAAWIDFCEARVVLPTNRARALELARGASALLAVDAPLWRWERAVIDAWIAAEHGAPD